MLATSTRRGDGILLLSIRVLLVYQYVYCGVSQTASLHRGERVLVKARVDENVLERK